MNWCIIDNVYTIYFDIWDVISREKEKKKEENCITIGDMKMEKGETNMQLVIFFPNHLKCQIVVQLLKWCCF